MKASKVLSPFLPVAPIFFAISFVLALFLHNIGELSLGMLTVPLIVTVLFAAILSTIFNLLLRNKMKGNLFSSIFIILFFSYGEIISLLKNFYISIGSVNVGKNHILFPIWVLALLLSFLIIRRTKKDLLLPNRFVLIMAVFATLLPLLAIARYEISQRLYPGVKSPLILPEVDKATLENSLPDIYYLIPDSYSASWVLQTKFNYDNSSFVEFLKNKGFYVASQSASNYPKTFLSLSSSLNMEYLDYLSIHKNSSNQTIVGPLINNNNVVRFLKALGYKYYQMGSWWDLTHYNPLADDNFILESKNLGGVGEFNYIILKSTMINPFMTKLLPKVAIGESDEDKRDRIIYQFEELPRVKELPSPKFVFVHIIAPHEPYVFGKNCEFLTSRQIEGKKEEESYVNQVNCINQKLEEAIKTIINNTPHSPVILLQSDEGAPFLRRKVTPEDSWGKASPELLKEKFPILSAYYLPGVSESLLYSSITPVNSFRVVFNFYFSTHLPLLPDKNYIFPDMSHLFEFEDVTEEVKSSPQSLHTQR